jgi:hypothetical protein
MNTAICQNASSRDTRAGTKGMQDQWDDRRWQQRGICSPFCHLEIVSHANVAQRATMNGIPEHSNYATLTTSRKRADSHQPSATPHAQQFTNATQTEQSPTANILDDERPRRFSSADFGYVGNRLSPQLSPTNPYGEVRRLSGNFNSPTHVELERTKEHRKSMKGVEKLRSRVKNWVRA